MIFKGLKTGVGVIAAAVTIFAAGVSAGASDNVKNEIPYVLSSQIDEKSEDGQYPRYRVSGGQSADAGVDLSGTGTLFGVKIPTHSEVFADAEKTIGIDVSKWNGDIDWAKVKAQGIDYAIIRVGYRGYGSSGTLVLDTAFENNIKNALKNDIKVGVYFFTQAINTAEAVEEAKFVLERINGFDIDLPVVIDIEDAMVAEGDTSRVDDARLSRQQFTNICIAFCDTVKAAGYTPMVYANPNWLNTILYRSQLENEYLIWLANYVNKTSYSGKYVMWQYSDSGMVNGIPEYVDLNAVYIEAVAPPENLTGVVATTSDGKKVTLFWDSVWGADGYEIYKVSKTDDSLSYIKIGTTEDTYFEVAKGDYTDGEVNSYAVKSYRNKNGGKVYSDMTNDYHVNVKYTSPDGVKVTAFKETAVSLSWNEYENADLYIIYIKNETDSSYRIAAHTASNSCLVSGLEAATVYDVKILARIKTDSGYEFTPYSATYSLATKPGAPQNVIASKKTTDSITLSWDTLSEADGYVIYSYDEETATYTKLKTLIGTGTTAEITKLESGKEYIFYVCAFITTKDRSFAGSKSDPLIVCTTPATPENVKTVSYVNSIKLSWTGCGEDVTYNVYVLSPDTKKYTVIANTAKLSYTVKNLERLTNYTFKVKAIATDKTAGGASAAANTYTSVEKTQNLKAIKITSTAVTLGWDKVEGATAYAVYTFNSDTGKYSLLKTVKGETYTVTGLPSGKSCTFCVRAYVTMASKNYFGEKSDDLSVATTPTQVKNLTFDHTGAQEKTVTLSWTKQKYVTGYQIYRYDDTAKKYVYVTTAKTNYATLNLPSGTDCTFKVRAVTQAGTKKYVGAFSQACEAFTRTAPPTAIKLKTNSASSITLTWDKPTGATGYAVYRYNKSNNTYTLLGKTTSTSFTVKGLKAGASYQFAVKSSSVWGSAVWYSGYSKTATLVTLPAKVTGLKITATNHNAAALAWNKVTGATSYRVYSYNKQTKKYTFIKETTENKLKVTGLASGTEHHFVVKSMKKSGNVNYSSPYLSALVTTFTAPALPTDVKLKSNTVSTMTVTWAKSKNASGYRVYIYDKATSKYVSLGDITANSYTFKGLSAGTEYTIAVKPFVSYGGNKIYSSVYVKKLFTTLPARVTGFKITSTNHNAAALAWNKVTGATSYRVYSYNKQTKKYTFIKETTENKLKVTGLASGTEHHFVVKSMKKSGGVNYSSPYLSALVTTFTAPALPTDVKLKSNTVSTMTVTWAKSKNASGYRVYIYDKATSKYVSLGDITANSYTFKGLSAGTEYTIAVKPFVSYGGNKIYSSVYVKKSFATAPAQVKGITLTASEKSNISFTWKKVTGADGYNIYYLDESTNTYRVIAQTAQNSVTLQNLEPQTLYGFKVRAYCEIEGGVYFGTASSLFSAQTK